MSNVPEDRITLNRVVGHDRVIDTLRQAHAGDTVHHAMLFAGPAGVGKFTIARAFAAMMNCTDRAPGGDACGVCKSCRRILGNEQDRGGGHPDVFEVRPDGRQIKIAQIRDLIRVVAFPPIEANVRVVIIEPADALGEEAANALLKTLEEPSSHTRFILVSSSPDALLITIRSRCQRVLFGRIPDDALAGLLEARFKVTPEQARDSASVADGSLGEALALLEDPVMSQRNELLARLLAIPPGDALACFALAADLYDLRSRIRTVLDVLARLYRDVLLVRVGALALEDVAHPALKPQIEAAVSRYGVRALMARVDLIEDTRHGIVERNLNPRLSLERMVLALTAEPGREGVTFSAQALTDAGR